MRGQFIITATGISYHSEVIFTFRQAMKPIIHFLLHTTCCCLTVTDQLSWLNGRVSMGLKGKTAKIILKQGHSLSEECLLLQKNYALSSFMMLLTHF